MSILIACPLAATDKDGKGNGHTGRKGEGYSVGGAAYHATRCPEMAAVLGVEAPVVTGKGPATLAEAVEAAAAKWAAKSAPTLASAAAERVDFGGRKGRFIPD